MNRLLIYIGDYLINLFGNSILPITYQSFDVRDLRTRGVSYSSAISLPITPQNKIAFGFPEDVNSAHTEVYEKLPARVIYNGTEYFRGFFEVSDANEIIKGNIYGKIIDVFDQVKGRKLYTLGYLTDSPWTTAERLAAINNTSGVLAPVIDYGGNSIIVTSAIVIRLLPAHSYKEILNLILQSTGYTFVGDVLTANQDLDDLVLPFSQDEFEYIEEYETDHHFEATQSTPQVYTPPPGNSSQDISLDVANQVGVYFNTTLGRYVLPNVSANDEIGRIGFELFIDFTIVASVLDPAGMNVRIAIDEDTSGGPDTDILLTSNIFVTASPFRVRRRFTLSDQAALSDTNYGVVLRVQDGTGTIDSITINEVVFSGGLSRVANTNWLFHNYLLPDLEFTSILQDFFVRFGVFMTPLPDGVTIRLDTLKESIRHKEVNAVDWTSKRVKRVKGEDDIKFKDEYAQNNYFKYTEGEGVRPNLGTGNLQVLNENIEPSNDYFTSDFENTETHVPEVIFDTPINMAYIPIYGPAAADITDFQDSPGLKLIMIRQNETDEPELFDGILGGDITSYKVGYFVDQNYKHMGFDYFLEQYYSELQGAIERLKAVKRDYNLTVEDMSDPPVIVYDSGNYFLVGVIPNFISGKVTKNVELLRIW